MDEFEDHREERLEEIAAKGLGIPVRVKELLSAEERTRRGLTTLDDSSAKAAFPYIARKFTDGIAMDAIHCVVRAAVARYAQTTDCCTATYRSYFTSSDRNLHHCPVRR